jgi:hypothetical protein
MRGRHAECRKVLDYMHSWQPDYNSDAMFAQLEYTLEKESEVHEMSKQSSYLDCFKGTDLRRTFCAVFPPITQNLTGQNLAGTYATYFFQLAGSTEPLVDSVITTAVSRYALLIPSHIDSSLTRSVFPPTLPRSSSSRTSTSVAGLFSSAA